MIRYFLTFTADTPLVEPDLERLVTLLGATPGMTTARIHLPASAHDPYLHDGRPPALIVECDFPAIEPLEAALSVGGGFEPLETVLPSLAGVTITQQAMLARRFPVPDPALQTAPGARPCTYMVAYEGMADDLNLWLRHYMSHHTPVMARFPGIREIEVFTRIDWCSALPWPRVAYMQRNKVVFDNPDALNVALNSPVRDEMRADFHKFPPFSGKVTHFPMTTLTVIP